MEHKEIIIPVPWGHVAGKAYGNEKDEIVIALHGYQDNANSFNKLIPLLPKSFYYMSIDFPGHGKSSHFETKTLVTYLDFVLALKLILDYLNRNQYIIMAHSFGCQTDGLIYIPQHTVHFLPRVKKYLTKYSTLNEFTTETAPIYTLAEALQRMKNGRAIHMSDETAKLLAERALIPVGNGKYKIATAQFLKYAIRLPLTLKQINFIIKNFPLNFPHLFIKASETEPFYQIIEESIEEFRRNKYFEVVTVEGTHDVHLEEPEKIAPIISQFLLKNVHKL